MKSVTLTTGKVFFSKNIQHFIKEAKRLRDSDDIVERNLLFAVKVASNMANSTNTLDELLSPALEGLTEAKDSYNPKRAKFTTWAYFKIKGKILKYIQSKSEYIEIDNNIPEPDYIDTQWVRELLDLLPPQERELIDDIYYKDFSYQDLSSKYGITGVGLKEKEKRIIKKLKIISNL